MGKPDFIERDPSLSDLWDKIKQESEILRKPILGSSFSLWDIYNEKNENKLATIFRNQIVKNELEGIDCKKEFPYFGEQTEGKISDNFKKGEAKARALDTASTQAATSIFSLADENKQGGDRQLNVDSWNEIFKNLDGQDIRKAFSFFFKSPSETTKEVCTSEVTEDPTFGSAFGE